MDNVKTMKSVALALLLAAAILARSACAALALDGSTGATNGSGGTSFTMTLSTTSANDDIIVGVAANGGVTVSSVTASGLTFTKRASVATNETEEWYAVASSALSSEVITVTFSGASTYYAGAAFGISGADTSTIWDSNSSVPATTTSSSVPVSTNNANDFIFGILRSGDQPTPTAGSGWTAIYNGTGSYFMAEYQIVSTTQSGLSVNLSLGTPNGIIGDAVMQASSGGSCTHAGWNLATRTFTVPTSGSGSFWHCNGNSGTVDCSTQSYWQSGRVCGVN